MRDNTNKEPLPVGGGFVYIEYYKYICHDKTNAMPFNTKLLFTCILVFSLGIIACKKDKSTAQADEANLFKISNFSGETLNLKLYRSYYDFSHDKTPVLDTRVKDNNFIYLDPAEYDASNIYYIDYYNDDRSYTNWGIKLNSQNGADICYSSIGKGRGFIIYKRGKQEARNILLKDDKPSVWKAIDAFSGKTSLSIWDTLNPTQKNYTLSFSKMGHALIHAINMYDTMYTPYEPKYCTLQQTAEGNLFYGYLNFYGDGTHAVIYNYTKPYTGNLDTISIPGVTGSRDTLMMLTSNNTNYYMMVRQ